MHVILSNLLVALLLIPSSTLGCCWYWHGKCADHSPTASATACKKACCAHRKVPGRSTPVSPAPECKGICHYLTEPKTEIEAGSLLGPVDALNCPYISAAPSVKPSLLVTDICDRVLIRLPVRLHALNAVFLI